MGRSSGRSRSGGSKDEPSTHWAVHLAESKSAAPRPAQPRSDSRDSDQTEAIARRVATLVAERAEVRRYLDTGAVAEMVGMSEHWVREHAAELGASRLGDGARGALRFDPDLVRAAIHRRRLVRAPEGERQRRSGRASAGGVELVAFRDRSTE